jgi:hypothetical protein
MSELDKIEYEKLTELASKLETVLNRAGPAQSGVTALLTTALGRIENLQQEGVLNPEQDEKRKNQSIQEIAIAAIVARETRLSQDEKIAFTEFLEKDYFTKKDVKNIDSFYSSSWDKLTDQGKAQMSQRMDEGVRQGELEYHDFSPNTLKKEIQGRAQRNEIIPASLREQQPLFESYDKGSQTEAKPSSDTPSPGTSVKETASSQDADLLAQSFEGVSFAATDIPKSAENSTGRTA